MRTRVVGVDIGADSIRGVEVERRGARIDVVRSHAVALPEGAVRSGEVLEVNTVATVLKQLWSEGGFRSKKVVLGIGNAKVLVRDLTVPRQHRRDIKQSLAFQVQDLLPVPVADALLDFYPVSEGVSDAGPTISGLLIAAVKSVVEANVSAVRIAGLSPVAVDLIPFAVSRVFAPLDGDEAIAVIDMGAFTTNVVIVRAGVPQFVRIIPTGGSDLTTTLARTLETSAQHAEGVKRATGLIAGAISPEQIPAAEVIHGFAGELLNSLRNTLSFYLSTRQDVRIDRIVLCGGASGLNGFATALAEVTRLPVVPGDALIAVPNARASVSAASSKQDMTVAFALASGAAA